MMDESDGESEKAMHASTGKSALSNKTNERNIIYFPFVDKTSTFKKAQWKLIEISVALFFIAFKNNMRINPLIRS
jgi:hypothetical protein